MPRTTLNIDGPVLRDLKRIQKREGKPLGRLVSDLLASVLAAEPSAPARSLFQWISRPMRFRVEPTDKEALWAALESEIAGEDPEVPRRLRD